MEIDKRRAKRYESHNVNVKVIRKNEEEIKGRILDVSRSGISLEMYYWDNEAEPKNDEIVDIYLMHEMNVRGAKIAEAIIKRVWNERDYFGYEKGIAAEFINYCGDSFVDKRLFKGIEQKDRIQAQKEVVTYDINHLSEYRSYLNECQMKLFEMSLVVGVALATIYFSLTFLSQIGNYAMTDSLFFWKAMLAALPGILAISCCLIFVQKSISIQRIDSYLAVLKDCILMEQYPREYRGWETESRKLRHVLNTTYCSECIYGSKVCGIRMCGKLTMEDQIKNKRKLIINNPKIDLFNIIAISTFLFMSMLSILAIFYSIINYHWGISKYMVISSVITIIMSLIILYIGSVLYNLRKGKYSNVSFRRSWLDLMTRCSKIS